MTLDDLEKIWSYVLHKPIPWDPIDLRRIIDERIITPRQAAMIVALHYQNVAAQYSAQAALQQKVADAINQNIKAGTLKD